MLLITLGFVLAGINFVIAAVYLLSLTLASFFYQSETRRENWPSFRNSTPD